MYNQSQNLININTYNETKNLSKNTEYPPSGEFQTKRNSINDFNFILNNNNESSKKKSKDNSEKDKSQKNETKSTKNKSKSDKKSPQNNDDKSNKINNESTKDDKKPNQKSKSLKRESIPNAETKKRNSKKKDKSAKDSIKVDRNSLNILQDRTAKRKEIIDNAVSKGQLNLVDFTNLKGEELKKELEKQNKEREKRMQKYIKFDETIISDNAEEENLDDKILTLENELATLKENIKNILEKPIEKESSMVESKALLVRKKDWLTFKSLELEHIFDDTGYKFEMLEKKHKAMHEALKNIESVKTDMKKIVKYRAVLNKLQNGLVEADNVIEEMQNMAYGLLPANVSKHCKNVQETRKRLMDMQDDLLEKKHFTKKELIITKKEILAIKQAVLGEEEASKLLENRKEQEILRLVNFQAKNNEIDETIESCNAKLDLMNLTLEEAQEMALKIKKEANEVKRKASLKKFDSQEDDVERNLKAEKIIETKQMNDMIREQIISINNQIKEIDSEIVKNDHVVTLGKEITKILEQISKATIERRNLTEKLQTERVLRKTYFNQIEDMKGAIKVYCRVRPMNKSEMDRKDVMCVEFPDIYTVVIKQPEKKAIADRSKEYVFDRVFPMVSSQQEIFQEIDRLIETVFTGFNVCIFAYGQTGSGKTYTLIGDMDSKEQMGVVPRAFIRFYELIDANKQTITTETNFYMIELYNDKLLDLMKPDAEYVEKLKILKNEHGMVIVPGVTMLSAKGVNDMIKYFHIANNHRHIAETKMNSQSSRSHLILTIMFTFTNVTTKKRFFGKISMVDLAGSERISKSGVSGINQIEATSINKALTSLGDVISALTSMNKGFIPYRNNKLTQLMQDSLGGTAKTLLIVNLSPSEYNVSESISSLNYAARMKTIVNENLKVADEEEVENLKIIIQKLLRGESVIIT